MKGSVSVSPELESLDGANTFDLAEAICTTMDIRPDDVNIEEIDQILSAQVSLKLDGPFDSRKLVPNLDILIVNTDSLVGDVTNSMRLLKSQISLHIGGVVVRAMA